MEEQILNILESNTEDEDVDGFYTAEVTDVDKAAKEITSIVMEFILWLSLNAHIATSYSPMYYLYAGVGENRHIDFTKEHHIDEVYKEWLNIKE
jgi:hypothetical protein